MLRMAHFYTNRQASLLVAVATVVAGLLVLIHTPIHFMAPFTVDNDYDFSNATLLLADEVSPPFHPVNMFMATYARYNTEQGNKKINRVPEQCKLVHLSMIARHGTRQPHRREIYQFKKLERVLQKHRHKSWPEWLANWQNPYTLSKAGSLTTQGKYDLASLAKRDVQRYDKWLGKTAYERHKHARYLTYTVPQIMTSARAYGSVYSGHRFSDKSLNTVSKKKSRNESISEACPRWIKLTRNKKVAKKAFAPYEKQYMSRVLKALSKLLKFNVTEKTFKWAVNACSYENAIYAQYTHWCKILGLSIDDSGVALDIANTTEHTNSTIDDDEYLEKNKTTIPLALLDFKEDINKYYKYGNGLEINSKIASSFLQNVITEMETAISKDDKINAHLRFGHTGTIILILTQLGMYTESPKFNKNRAFRLSHIVPFAANLHFELLQCSDTHLDATQHDNYYVRILHNELPIRIPGCPQDTDLCPWDKFREILKKRIGGVDFDKVCRA